jgi:hypothetical protein
VKAQVCPKNRGGAPLLLQGPEILGDALLGDAELSADLPLADAAQIQARHAAAALEDAQALVGIATRHSLPPRMQHADIVRRLGRSPDAGDAVVLCNWWRGVSLNPTAFSGQSMMTFGS